MPLRPRATRERNGDGLRAVPGYWAQPSEGDGVGGERMVAD